MKRALACLIGSLAMTAAVAFPAGDALPRAGARPMPATGAGKPPDPANATYRIDGKQVSLRNGDSWDGSLRLAPCQGLRPGGCMAYGDLNGDGWPDVAAVVMEPEGSTWLAALLGDGTGTGQAVEGVWLGDRILLEGVEAVGCEVLVTGRVHSPHGPPDSLPTVEGYALRHGRLVRTD